MSFEEEKAFEHTLLVVRKVYVFKIPPRSIDGSYKCEEWLQPDKIWTVRLRFVSFKDRFENRLEDSNKWELFVSCYFYLGHRESSVDSVVDSSFYFVLKIEDGRGKHAFISFIFTERNEAFDFNYALFNHEKYIRREKEKEKGEENEDGKIEIHPAVNQRLKEGETIYIKVQNKASAVTGMLSAACLTGSVSSTGRQKASLAPPLGSGRIRSPLPLPPNDTVTTKIGSVMSSIAIQNIASKFLRDTTRHNIDPLSDLSKLDMSLPSTTSSGSTKTTYASIWEAL